MPMDGTLTLGLTGASGFVGRHLIDYLTKETSHHIKAFSRYERESLHPQISCVQVNLFRYEETLEALTGCDIAVFLVHSMLPASRHCQGEFSDFDYVIADNFARACMAKKVKQILYVGGILGDSKDLSPHLKSRWEVEQVLARYGTPLSVVRCGMVIGKEGSSFRMMVRLLERLPVMILPKWMLTLSHPVFIDDLVRFLVFLLESGSKEETQIYDLGMEQPTSYKFMIQSIARVLHRHPLLIDFPGSPIALSKLWVRVISGAPKDLVYPLIESVRHPMLKSPDHRPPEGFELSVKDLHSALELTFHRSNPLNHLTKIKQSRPLTKRGNLITSIQRLQNPTHLNAKDIATLYTDWLPSWLSWLIRIKKTPDGFSYHSRGIEQALIRLQRVDAECESSREVFAIKGGILAEAPYQGTFEFRTYGSSCFVILNDFSPALPWPLYRLTQNPFHLLVVGLFSRHLSHAPR